MVIDLLSKDCFLLITDVKYEHVTKLALAGLLQHTNYDIVLYTQGYRSSIKNPRIHLHEFNFAGGSWHMYNSMNLCKPFIALDMIENGDYDRVLFVDSDVLFTPKINNVFNGVRGYLENLPLYPPCPFFDPTVFTPSGNSESKQLEERLLLHYAFNGKLYAPELNKSNRIWYRQGHSFMFNKSCRGFFQDVVDQIRTAYSHPEQSCLMKMYDFKGNPISGWRYPINAEEGYINTTLWKYSSDRVSSSEYSSYLSCYIQEILDEEHHQWVDEIYAIEEPTKMEVAQHTSHPLWKNWIHYEMGNHPNDVANHAPKWGGVPVSESGACVEPSCYHFSFPCSNPKDYMHIMSAKLGGYDESIFNC